MYECMNVLQITLKKGVHTKMAHVRKNCSKPSQTVSFDPKAYEIAENYQFNRRKKNFSHSVNELIILGQKYVELLERQTAKKKERMLG